LLQSLIQIWKQLDSLINELIVKIKIASTAKLGHWKENKNVDNVLGSTNAKNKNVIIAIGASPVGTEAIYEVIRKFPEDMPGVVIVQHMPRFLQKCMLKGLIIHAR
jgi:two-component system chemotaxis response regulator CheB